MIEIFQIKNESFAVRGFTHTPIWGRESATALLNLSNYMRDLGLSRAIDYCDNNCAAAQKRVES